MTRSPRAYSGHTHPSPTGWHRPCGFSTSRALRLQGPEPGVSMRPQQLPSQFQAQCRSPLGSLRWSRWPTFAHCPRRPKLPTLGLKCPLSLGHPLASMPW